MLQEDNISYKIKKGILYKGIHSLPQAALSRLKIQFKCYMYVMCMAHAIFSIAATCAKGARKTFRVNANQETQKSTKLKKNIYTYIYILHVCNK